MKMTLPPVTTGVRGLQGEEAVLGTAYPTEQRRQAEAALVRLAMDRAIILLQAAVRYMEHPQ
jgi:hypothetical protein